MLWKHGAEAYVLTHPWLPALMWAILYISDYWLTLVGQRYYSKQSTVEYVGSYELTPDFQEDIDNKRPISVHFVIYLVFVTATLYLVGLISTDIPYMYGWLVGFLIVPQLVVHVRHMGNIVYFRRLSRPDSGVSGKLRAEQHFTYWLSSQNTLGMMLLAFVLFVFTNSPILLGGIVALAWGCYGHHKLAKEHRLRKDQSETDTATVESEQSTT